jgi:hypothetical protein
MLLSGGWSLASAKTFKIYWLDMEYDLRNPNNPVFVSIGNTVTSGSVFNLPDYGNVEITYTYTGTLNRTRGQSAAAQNGWVNPSPDWYSWKTIDWLDQVNYAAGNSDPVQYTVTYTFTPPVPARQLVLGVAGLGRMDEYYHDNRFISKITVANNGSSLGDWNLGTCCGPTSFTGGTGSFELINSLPGNGIPGDPSFNSNLGVVRIDSPDPVNDLTLDVTHIGQDGFSFTVGYLCPVDAWMKDKDCDDGSELPPSCPLGTPMWMSDDIWVRNQNDGLMNQTHQNPIAQTTNHVYVKLRNHGCGPIYGELLVYWAYASSGLVWDPTAGNWLGHNQSTGDMVGGRSVSIPHPPPGLEEVFEIPWTPPGAGHICLLARLVGSDPMAVLEGSDIYINTWNNNNIAWKNLIVVNPWIPPNVARFLVRNVKPLPSNLDLEFNSAGGGDGIPFLDGGSVRVALSPEMFNHWMGAGGMGQGIIVNPDSSITLTSLLAKIQGIPMGVDETQPVEMYFAADSGSSTPAFQRFVVSQFSDGQTTPDGGVTFEFRSGAGGAIPTLTEWGLIIFGVMLLGFITWVFVKRRKAVAVS